jgi:hypothetical protein
MGVSNPSARGYAVPTMVSTAMQNREQVGGPAKAGLGRHIGMGQFVYGAIVNGAAGHPAPAFAGPNYPAAFAHGRVSSRYPISRTNQLSNVGMGRHGSMFRTPADGVNAAERTQMTNMVRFFNPLNPMPMTRGLSSIPRPNRAEAPGHGYPWGGLWQRT